MMCGPQRNMFACVANKGTDLKFIWKFFMNNFLENNRLKRSKNYSPKHRYYCGKVKIKFSNQECILFLGHREYANVNVPSIVLAIVKVGVWFSCCYCGR